MVSRPQQNAHQRQQRQVLQNATEEYPTGSSDDNANFYSKNCVGDVPCVDCGTGEFYVHVDAFGNMSFYDNRCAAMRGCTSDRIDLAPIAGDIEIGPLTAFDYSNGEWDCYGGPCSTLVNDYTFSDVEDNATDVSMCQSAPNFIFPQQGSGDYNNADVQDRAEWGSRVGRFSVIFANGAWS